jgi:UDP-glucose 4-epimerase
MKDKPVALVTGGAGFIGSHVVMRLAQAGYSVRVLDNLESGKIANIPDGVEFIRGDVSSTKDVEGAMRGVSVSIHLAAVASVARSIEEYAYSHRVNIGGFVNIVEAAKQSDSPIQIRFASSAAIYGAADVYPIPETLPAKPISPYGVDKYSCELHAKVAAEIFNLDIIGFRFFNVYGPRQDPKSSYAGVISLFMDKALRRIPVEVFGDGLQTRDFVYVEDVADAIIGSLRLENSKLRPRVFNICTGAGVSLLQLLDEVGSCCQAPIDRRFHSARSGDIRNSVGSNELLLRWMPEQRITDFATGIRSLFEYNRLSKIQ